ncbi:DNA-directed RNA polymerases I and III subunit RPAC1 [Plasmodiophora brassicae]
MPSLPDNLEAIRSRVFIEAGVPTHTAGIDDALAFKSLNIDNSLDLDRFREGLKCSVLRLNEQEIVFELVGIDAPIANALRRVLIAEVPTIAIEKVNIYQNTSIMQDEVLAHRLGLVPILADPRKMEYPGERATPQNTLVFTLVVTCTENPRATALDPPHVRYINSNVYSRDLKWVPQPGQEEMFEGSPPRVVDGDILLCQLRPGQTLELELFCEKGIGQTHAKWSPVCTASYKLKPEVIIPRKLTGSTAEALVNVCPMNVFDIEDDQAVVARPDKCTMCRECIRDKPWGADGVQLRRIRDHFIFTVESTGIYRPDELLAEALDVLVSKCNTIVTCLDELHR